MFLTLKSEQFLDCLNIRSLFLSLDGFLCQKETLCVLDNLCLLDGSPWTIPITLDISYEIYKDKINKNVILKFDNVSVGFIDIQDFPNRSRAIC